tara:strand:- start:792 stop:980 length:189 start_codon:yes stop_codon:yes gene_type:complete
MTYYNLNKKSKPFIKQSKLIKKTFRILREIGKVRDSDMSPKHKLYAEDALLTKLFETIADVN